MIHSSTQFCCTPVTRYCHSSYISFVLETSILLPPPSILFQNISTSPFSSSTGLSRHGPQLHVAGPKIAICETASNVVFVLNSAFTSKDQYFQAALHEATNAFNEMLHSFGYTQKLEHCDPHQHQAHPPQQHPLYN